MKPKPHYVACCEHCHKARPLHTYVLRSPPHDAGRGDWHRAPTSALCASCAARAGHPALYFDGKAVAA